MPSLRTLLSDKARLAMGSDSETPYQSMLEKGLIYFFTPGRQGSTSFLNESQCFCWNSPGCGTAIIEIWGASGSGASMCCCGAGLPGNPGAYSRKTVEVFPGSFVCGCTGMSCGNATSVCTSGGLSGQSFRGCSEGTGICWCTCSGSASCMCAMGGRGGWSRCMDGGAGPYCCFGALGFCISRPNLGITMSNNCGIVCHYCDNGGSPPEWIALAYGGDVNCCGGFSCMTFYCCQPSRPCSWNYHVRTSAGIISEDGVVLTFQGEEDQHHSNSSGGGFHQLLYTLNAAARSPSMGHGMAACWSGHRSCGCYETHGCQPFLPYGVPGTPPSPCSGVRDHAIRGGHGAVRIQYIGT